MFGPSAGQSLDLVTDILKIIQNRRIMTLILEQRPDILQLEIDRYVSKGYNVLSQSNTSAQLIRKKKFSLLWALFWLIFGVGIGLIIYALVYMAAHKEEAIYLL